MILYNESGQVIGEIYEEHIQPPEVVEPTPPNTNYKKIAMCVSHQSDNQGAYGSEGEGEWGFNHTLINNITGKISNPNVRIFMRDKNISGYTNQMIDLHQKIDAWGADISVEMHFNSFSSDSVQGHEVLGCSDGGMNIAEYMNECFDEELPTSNRGAKRITSGDNGGGFCCRGVSLAIITEPYFGAHQHKFVDGGELRENLIRAYVKFIDTV